MKKIKHNQSGFVWQELVVALAIGGLLALVSGVLLHNSRQQTRDIKRIADIQTIRHALELYFYDCNVYPHEVKPTGQISGVKDCQGNIYLQRVPFDFKNIAYDYVPCRDLNSKDCSPDTLEPKSYQLYYSLEANREGIPKGLHAATPTSLLQ